MEEAGERKKMMTMSGKGLMTKGWKGRGGEKGRELIHGNYVPSFSLPDPSFGYAMNALTSIANFRIPRIANFITKKEKKKKKRGPPI